MKAILMSNVAKLGKKYEIVEVKPGYARNFLFPRGLAEAITKTSAGRVAELQKKREVEKTKQEAILKAAIPNVGGKVVSFVRAANEEGHLYEGVSARDIALALSTEIGVEIPESHVELSKTIKELGEHSVTVTHDGKEFLVTASVTKSEE